MVDDKDRFRLIVVKLIEGIVKQPPSIRLLLKLLQLAKPDFSETDLLNEVNREKAYRCLKVLIHPDKHLSDGSITTLFQEVQNFYRESCYCLKALKEKKKRKAAAISTTTTKYRYPSSFHVKDRWAHTESVCHPEVPVTADDFALISRAIAYKCINFRGAIAHGKKTDLYFDYKQMISSATAAENSVEEVFAARGGAKVLSTPEAIKEELLINGPVVSLSFKLTRSFLDACEHSKSFAVARGNQAHPLVIVGWKHTSFGEMWLTRSLDGGTKDIPIAFGQFCIDDECVAPTAKFENTPWQDEKKAFDIPFGSARDDWYTWPEIQFYANYVDLSTLSHALGCGFVKAGAEKREFVLRDKDRIARSRKAYLSEVSWSPDRQGWRVDATFTD